MSTASLQCSVLGTFRVILPWLLSCFLVACSKPEQSVLPDLPTKPPSASIETFIRLRAGMTAVEVNELLGVQGRHGFTYVLDDHHVLMLSIYRVHGSTEYANVYYLGFRDGRLELLIDGHDLVDYFRTLRQNNGSSGPLLGGRAFDDDDEIRETLKVKAARGVKIAQSMEGVKTDLEQRSQEFEVTKSARQNDSGNVWPAFVKAGALSKANVSRRVRAYQINSEQCKTFDGAKVMIGMTRRQVNRLFDVPLFSERLKSSCQVAIYGPSDPMPRNSVSPEVGVSPIMVLFRDDKAVRVVSYGFFDDSWKGKIWPRK